MPAEFARRANVFRLQHGREPTAEDVGADPADWKTWTETTHTTSIDEAADDGREQDELPDELNSADARLAAIDLNRRFMSALDKLAPRSQDIAKDFFIDGLTAEEVSARRKITIRLAKELRTSLEVTIRKVLAA
jgi:DNA-directed RNA polymerase specialized sigma subunit